MNHWLRVIDLTTSHMQDLRLVRQDWKISQNTVPAQNTVYVNSVFLRALASPAERGQPAERADNFILGQIMTGQLRQARLRTLVIQTGPDRRLDR